MKGKKKYIVPLLLAGVTTATGTGLVTTIQQNVNVSASTGATVTNTTKVDGAIIQLVEGFADKYTINDTVTIKAECADANVTLEYVVTKNGEEVPVTVDNSGYGTFTAEYVGYYNISIKAKSSDDVIVSTMDNLSIWVEKEDASIKLVDNSYYVIPAKMPQKQTGLKIPAPSIITDDGEERIARAITGENERVVVKLVTPKATDNEVPLTLTQDDNKGDYYEVTNPTVNLEKIGTYRVVYEYQTRKNAESDYNVIARLSSSFQVVDAESYDTSKIDLKVKESVTLSATGNIGADIKVPRITIVDANASTDTAIKAYVQVSVYDYSTNTKLNTFDYDTYTFTTDKAGQYYVIYEAQIPLFGTEKLEYRLPKRITVSDTEDPVISICKPYAIGENGNVIDDEEDFLEDRESEIPSFVVLDANGKAKINLPAMYATDNASSYAELKANFKRTWTGGTSSKVNTVDAPANEDKVIEIDGAGTWEIQYYAKDAKGNDAYKIYRIQAYEKDNATIKSERKTKVELNVGVKAVSDKDETLTFAKPSVTDNFITDKGNVTADSNIKVVTYYDEFDGENGTGNALATEQKVAINSNGKCEIKVEDLNDNTKSIRIYTVAYLDTLTAGDSTVKTEYKQKEVVNQVEKIKYSVVNVVKAEEDLDAPEFVIDTDWNTQLFTANSTKTITGTQTIDAYGFAKNGANNIHVNGDVNKPILAAFDQNSDTEIVIPTVKFTDVFDGNLAVSMKVTNSLGEVVSLTKEPKIEITDKTNSTPYVYTISGAQFALSNNGMYIVEFRAEDINGHVTIKSYGIRVNDKENATIVIDESNKFGADKTISIGEEFIVPVAKIMKNGEAVGGEYEWQITAVSSSAVYPAYRRTTNGFVPLTEATFYITYTGTDDYENDAYPEQESYCIKSVDKNIPVISLDEDDVDLSADEIELPWNVISDTEKYMMIDIPTAVAYDNESTKDIVVTYTVSGPNGEVEVLKHDTLKYAKKFKATSQGKYTVTYSAKDEFGNEATSIVKIIKVGDCDKPTMKWKDESTNIPKTLTMENGRAELKFDLSNLTLSDLGGDTDTTYLEENLKISVTRDGKEVPSENSSKTLFYLTETGNYILKFTLKDRAGNENQYTYTINVPAEDAETDSEVSPVVGTVLVVISVVILAGVVVYFVTSSKKKGKGAKSTKSTKKSK